MNQWFCLSSFDPVTSAALLRQAGYVAYCPQEIVTKRRGRKVSDIKRPLWPGYLFACCLPQHLGAALVLGDASGFLTYTDSTGARGPLRMPPGVLIPVILAEAFGALDFTDTKFAAYRPATGDRVRIKAGAFRHYLATVSAVSKNRAKLNMDKGGVMTTVIMALEAA